MAAARVTVALMLFLAGQAISAQKYVSATAGSGGAGTLGNPWNVTDMNANAAAGDTVNLRAGTYSTAINPANPGSYMNPIVIRAYQGESVTFQRTSTVVTIAQNWVWVQGINIVLSPGSASRVIRIEDCDYPGIIGCTITGGKFGEWDAYSMSNVRYARILGNTCDRQDTLITTDGDRGDGWVLYGANSHFNVFEGNVVRRVSHYGIAVPYGSYTDGGRWNMVRANTTYLNHVGWGPTDWSNRNFYEANKSFLVGTPLTYRGGDAIEAHGDSCVFRYNQAWDDATTGPTSARTTANSAFLTQSEGGAYFQRTRLYGNTFLGKNSLAMDRNSVFAQNYTVGRGFGRNVWKNNTFAYPNPPWDGWAGNIYSVSFAFQWAEGTFPDTFYANSFWRGGAYGGAGDSVWRINDINRTMDYAKSTYPNNVLGSNIETSPLFADSISTGFSRSLAIGATSHLRDAGVPLTVVTSNVSNSVNVPVGDATYFYYNFGGNPFERGDSVLIGSVRAEIDSINANTLILTSPVTVSNNDPVHVLATWSQLGGYVRRLYGTGPDIGASEYYVADGPPPPSIPGSTTLVAPDSGSTQIQPITFRWRAVSGATKYWFSLSVDDWATLTISNSALTDTFLVVTGLTPGATALWNVATGNDAGWNTDAWGTWWTLIVGENPIPSEQLSVDWDNVKTEHTLDAATNITNSHLQGVWHTLVLKNPSGYTVNWPSEIEWGGPAPQPAAGGTSVYLFVRGAAVVYGFDLTATASGGGTGVTSSWVLAQLANYLRRDQNIVVFGDQEYREIWLMETSGPDTVKLRDNGGVLEFYDYVNGWKTLAELAAGGGGGTADADSIKGKPVDATRPDSSSAIVFDPAQDKYVHQVIAKMDSAGIADADSGAQVLAPHKGRIHIVTRPSGGGSGVTEAQLTDSLNERANDKIDKAGDTINGTLILGNTLNAVGTDVQLDKKLFVATGGTAENQVALYTSNFAVNPRFIIFNSSWGRYVFWEYDQGNDAGVINSYTGYFALRIKGTNWISVDSTLAKTISGYTAINGRLQVNHSPDGDISMEIYNGHANGYGLNVRAGNGTPYVLRLADKDNNAAGVFYGNGNAWFAGDFTVAGTTGAASLVGTTWYLKGSEKMWNKAESDYLNLFTRDTSGSEAVMDLENIGTINGKSPARIDSASIVVCMLDSTWIAYYGTAGVTPPLMSFEKTFIVDSVKYHLTGTGSNITLDVRYGYDPQVGSNGTGIVTTPSSLSPGWAWTAQAPNNATIPRGATVWVRVTAKSGVPMRATVVLKGRWVSG